MINTNNNDSVSNEDNIDNNKNEDKKYELYTEKIVCSPLVKYKKLIMCLKFVGIAVLFGIIASFVMVLVYPEVRKIFGMDQKQRQELTIDKDEYKIDVQEETLTDNEDIFQEDNVDIQEEIPNMSVKLKSVSAKIMRSIVTLDVYGRSDSSAIGEVHTESETAGVIIGNINDEYIILTSSSNIDDETSINVEFQSIVNVNAKVLGKDDDTGIAVISIKYSDIPMYAKSAFITVQFDNSYSLEQGNTVIAAGKLCGTSESYNYGIITGISQSVRTDNIYDIISTGINSQTGDYGFLFSESGKLAGIACKDNNGNFKSMGISNLKSLIEDMSNQKGPVYYGVIGQNVTGQIAAVHNIPVGIYITEVEMDSPAYLSGLQPGDIITAVNGEMVMTMQQYNDKLYAKGTDKEIFITAKRYSKDGYREMTFIQTPVRK